MSDSPPETPTNAARALIGWFAGGFAFKSVEALYDGFYATAAGYLVVAVIVAVVDYKLKTLLAKSPDLVRSLNQVASNARWWVAAVICVFIAIGLAPFLEKKPYAGATNNQIISPVQVVAPTDHSKKYTLTEKEARQQAIIDINAVMTGSILSALEAGQKIDTDNIWTLTWNGKIQDRIMDFNKKTNDAFTDC